MNSKENNLRYDEQVASNANKRALQEATLAQKILDIFNNDLSKTEGDDK